MTNQSHAARSVEALATHGDFVRALARRLVADPNEAEDVAQQTQLAALRSGPRDPEAARSWLAAITRNVARQNARGAASRRSRETTVARSDSVPSAAEIAEREATRRSVVQAVLALPEHYRAVILLRFYEDLPVREIANRLDLPRETCTNAREARTRAAAGRARSRARRPGDVAPSGRSAGSAARNLGHDREPGLVRRRSCRAAPRQRITPRLVAGADRSGPRR